MPRRIGQIKSSSSITGVSQTQSTSHQTYAFVDHKHQLAEKMAIIPYSGTFSDYGGGYQPLSIYTIGNLIQVCGAVKNTGADQQVGVIDIHYRPVTLIRASYMGFAYTIDPTTGIIQIVWGAAPYAFLPIETRYSLE